MKKWFDALTKTRDVITRQFRSLVGMGKIDSRTIEEFEEILIKADVPPRLAAEMLEAVRVDGSDDPIQVRLEKAMLDLLGEHVSFKWDFRDKPKVVLLTGVNGSGKTTTAAKLARLAKRHGGAPLLAAADTFRAAGTDQLRIWADRVGCECVSGVQGSDAAAVAFDAVKAALSRSLDIVLIDTAGRMHTKMPLMDELRKVHKTIGKCMPGAPHEVWMVVDAALGNNAISQVKNFHSVVPITGVVVAKLDGSSKAGFVLGLRKELGIPVIFAGLGEGMDDLEPFQPSEYVEALLGIESENGREQ